MAEFTLKPILLGFVLLLLLANFARVLGDNQVANTELTRANDTLTMTSGSAQTSNDDTTSLIFFGNSTNHTAQATTPLVIGTTVNLSRNGSLQLASISGYDLTTNGYYAVYDFEGDLYVVDTASRNLMGLIVIFFVLLGLAIAIKMFMDSSDNMNFGFK